ncbi:MAG: endonuclease MutS2, partial [Pseudobdellovibrionaceae bacterium]
MNYQNNLDWTEILHRIEKFATSEIAKTSIRETEALESSEARKRLNEIFSAMSVLSDGTRPHMTSLDLYPQWFTRLKKKAVLKTIEIKDVRLFCLETMALKEILTPMLDQDWIRKIQQSLVDAEKPLSAIDQIITPSGDIRSDASERLYSLYKEKEKLGREVQNALDRLVRDQQMETFIQEKYVTTREGRWVLPIRSGSQHFVPGVVHASSQTKQTVYIEPERVIPMNNRLRQIDVEIEEEIERILQELSHHLFRLCDEFEDTKKSLMEADVRFSQAQFSLLIEGKRFEFTDHVIELQELKHPLLKLTGKPVIGNTVRLDQTKSILLLSGPNAGGKTVLLKSIGLAAQMARCGFPICTEDESKIPYFSEILIGIGDSQSVDQELSTFAAHLKILNDSSKYQGPNNLILIDEICGSTDPEEGSALARSFIEVYAKNQVFAIVTSHLGPLKSGWTPESHILNGSLEYDMKSGKPTYQFISGLPGDSLAIQMAKRVGVDAEIVSRAVDLLSPTTRKRFESLEQIEAIKQEVGNLQAQLRKETIAAHHTKLKFEKMVKDFEAEKDDRMKKFLKNAEKTVEEAISKVQVEQTFKKHTALQEIKFALPEIVKAKPVPTTTTIATAEEFAQKFPPGSKVFVSSLNQDAIV